MPPLPYIYSCSNIFSQNGLFSSRVFRGEIMKKLLAKYGRHFWIVSLSVTVYASYDFAYNEGSFFDILMLSALTLLFYWQGQGKEET